MKNNPLLICFGTRPEWLKVKPLIKLMAKGEYKLLFTGQHPDLLRDIKVDYQINMSSGPNRLDLITSDCILQFPKGEFKGVLVQGDTGSAFGCALAAFNRQLKIYYLEAGLRSYDLQHPYPEEGYRQMISRISDINFAPTTTSSENLINEKTKGDIFVVGNSVLDNLIEYKNKCEYNNKVLVTLHRRENLHWINEWFKNINDLSKQNPHLDFILPLHPNPNIQKHKHLLSDVKVIEPLSHPELLNILVKCRLVISDSGGLQEEGTFLNKKVIVCRKTTERPEAISTGHLFLCKNPNELKGIFGELIDNYYIDTKCPYGEGNTANLVYKILKNEERF